MTDQHQGGVDDSGGGIAVLLDLIDRSSEKVPVVRYAFGLVGISACGAIIAGILGPTRSTIVIFGLTFVGAVLLFLFAKISTWRSKSIQSASILLLWAIVAFFCFFLLLTITALTVAWPEPWARFLGIHHLKQTDVKIRNEAIELCDQRIIRMRLMLDNPNNQMGDAERMADLIESCDPLQAENGKGSAAFYSRNYFEAVIHFENAYHLNPNDDSIKRNLADSYLEVGRYDDSLALYQQISAGNQLWNYKIARANFYKGQYDVAFLAIKSVTPDMTEDGGDLLGRALILRSAILLGKSKYAVGKEKNELIREAFHSFKDGVSLDPEKWRRILRITLGTKHEGFRKEAEMLSPYLDKWMAN